VEIQVIAHYFLAGLAMYWLARDFTKDKFAGLLAGTLFMSSGAMVAHAEHLAIIDAMAWYPLVFMFARRALLDKTCESFVKRTGGMRVVARFFLSLQISSRRWRLTLLGAGSIIGRNLP
jgi:hypothetical protein